jgi:3-methyladenine DNA glycosylase AlkD
VRGLRRRYTKELRDASPREVLATSYELLERYGHRFVAYELIASHSDTLASLGAGHLRRLGRGMAGWGDVDTFCCLVAGAVWREGQVEDSLIHSWSRSKDRWWRRSALVATVPLNVRARGGTGDTRRTLTVCRLLVDDHDDMIEKAMSWALRVLSDHDPAAVRRFLATHEHALASRVLREVRNKLATGLKNPRAGARA